MAPTSFRALSIILRIVTGCLACIGLALYTYVYIRLNNADFPQFYRETTAYPLAAAACSVAWNIVTLLASGRVRPVWHALCDLLDVVLLGTLGGIGFAHDDEAYISNPLNWGPNTYPWIWEERAGALILLISVLLQFSLVVFGLLAHRNAKKAGSQVTCPPYVGLQAPNPVDEEEAYIENNEKEFDVDWQSVKSSSSSSSVDKKPEPTMSKV